MAFGKAVRKIFTRDQEDENRPHAPPQANERRPRARSSSTARWWNNKSSSRERPHISGPFDPFPVLTPGAEIFDAQITSASLSQLLIWYVYYDVVQVPTKSSKWFKDLPGESMVGWIGLGMELKRTKSFPSKTLKLACDELEIDAGQVAARLVRLSDRISMLNSELDPKTTYETQFKKLISDLKLVESLRPIPRTQTERWKREIELCIRDYMEVVYLPVIHIGQMDPKPAITMEETHRRNGVRKRLDQVKIASRDPPPKSVYDQAQEMLGRNRVTFLNGQQTSPSKPVRASGDSERGRPRSSPPNGSERGRSRSIHTELDQDDTRRRSAPDLNDLELELNQMRAQCAQFAENLRNIRLQQGQTSSIQRADSLDPSSGPSNFHHEAARNPNPDTTNYGNYLSSDVHGNSLSHQPRVFQGSFPKRRLPKSTGLGIRRSSHDTTETARATATDAYETYPKRNGNGTLTHLPRNGYTRRLDEPSSHPMIRHGPTSPGQRPSYLRDAVHAEPARESPRQQHDANEEFDNSKYRLHGQDLRSLNRYPSRSSNPSLTDGSSFVTNPWATLDPNPALPLTDDRNRLAAHSPTLTHEPSLFMTPPSSPTMPMLNMPWQRIPGAWPLGSEAGLSRLGSHLRAMSPSSSVYNPVRGPSRATMAGFSDITDPGELTEAIRFHTRRAMASMVDLNSLPSRSSQSSERRRNSEANGDMERKRPEAVK